MSDKKIIQIAYGDSTVFALTDTGDIYSGNFVSVWIPDPQGSNKSVHVDTFKWEHRLPALPGAKARLPHPRKFNAFNTSKE